MKIVSQIGVAETPQPESQTDIKIDESEAGTTINVRGKSMRTVSGVTKMPVFEIVQTAALKTETKKRAKNKHASVQKKQSSKPVVRTEITKRSGKSQRVGKPKRTHLQELVPHSGPGFGGAVEAIAKPIEVTVPVTVVEGSNLEVQHSPDTEHEIQVKIPAPAPDPALEEALSISEPEGYPVRVSKVPPKTESKFLDQNVVMSTSRPHLASSYQHAETVGNQNSDRPIAPENQAQGFWTKLNDRLCIYQSQWQRYRNLFMTLVSLILNVVLATYIAVDYVKSSRNEARDIRAVEQAKQIDESVARLKDVTKSLYDGTAGAVRSSTN